MIKHTNPGSPKNEHRYVLSYRFDLKTVQLGFPMGLPLCGPLGNGLWEVRSSLPNRTEARLIFFQHKPSRNLVVVHAFIKKSQKTPKPDLDLALRRKREIEGSG
jgi:phage-related protein